MTNESLQWWPHIWGDYRRLGNAFWLFVYILTRMDAGKGEWKGNYSHIIREIGVSESTVRRWMRRLERCGYIERKLTNGAFVIRVKGMTSSSEPRELEPGEVVAFEGDV